MIQILRNMKLMQVSRISSPMVALPELLACSKAAAAVQYFRHVHFSFAVFAQVLGNSDLPNFRHLVADAAKCFKAFHAASSDAGPKHSGGFQKKMVPTRTINLRM